MSARGITADERHPVSAAYNVLTNYSPGGNKGIGLRHCYNLYQHNLRSSRSMDTLSNQHVVGAGSGDILQ